MIHKHEAAAFFVAALVVGVIVGLGAALLITLIEVVGDHAIRIREGESDWSSLDRWTTSITLPLGIMAVYLINKRRGSGVESGGVTEIMAGLSPRDGYLSTCTIGAKGANFFEAPIPPLSALHGRRVRKFHWPGEATLVSVRRGDRVVVPHGDTMLKSGDTITALRSGDARIELTQLLKPAPADDLGPVR